MKKMISDDYAVYLPAVNTLYADAIIRPIPKNRPFPSTFTLDDMVFWKDTNKLWYHPHFLHSVGQFKVGNIPNNAVTRRGRTDGILFGDSGGFQIGNGSLTGLDTLKANMEADEACMAWQEAYEVRTWILGFLETYTNYAMTIDMPLWATIPEKEGTPFHKCSHDQLTKLTVANLKFIESHRRNRTKWLNVIQGSDMTSIKKWWDAVKFFNGNGYALSSSAGRISGLGAVIEPLLMMRDEKAFKKGKDWIHMLGVSTAPWAIMLTAIQKALRANANSNLRISYDSSSPFQEAAIRELYVKVPDFGKNRNNWVFKKGFFPHSLKYVGSDEPLPFSSPIADKLTKGHLNVKHHKGIYTERQVDTLSLALVTNHNIWTYLETFKQANDLVFASNRTEVPDIYKECVDLIEHIFTVEQWKNELVKNQKLLDSFKG
jgi:hypothetical protein